MTTTFPRVLQVSVGLEERLGGPPEVTFDLAQYFKKRNSHLVVIGKPSRNYNERLFSEGIKYSWIKSPSRNSYGSMSLNGMLKFRDELRKSEIVFHHGFYLLTLLLTLTFAKKGSKVFVMPHGSMDPYGQRKNSVLKHIFRGLFELLRRRHLRVQIFTATEIEAHRVMTVLNEIEVKSIDLGIPVPNVTQAKNGNPEFFFTLSRITNVKRLDLAIQAIGELETKNILPLRIYGNGEEELKRQLRVLVDYENLSNLVTFEGTIDEYARKQLFKLNGILLVTSENENFSRVVAEAIVHGVPVVVSQGTALSDFVRIHKCGVVIEFLEPKCIAEAMNKLKTRYAEYSQNCIKSKSFLDIENTYKNLDTLMN